MTFLDSEVPTLLGEALIGLLFTCVGVPTYRNRSAAPPASRAGSKADAVERNTVHAERIDLRRSS